MGPFTTLAELLAPESVGRFLSSVWERAPLHLSSQNRARFESVLQTDDVDRLLTTLHLKHPEVSLVDASTSRQTDDYTYESGLIDPVRLFQCFDEGSTILLTNLELRHGPLATLCRRLESELGHRTQANVYFTPQNAQGFRTHYDNHDVFVLQTQGSKLWTLYDTPVALPYPTQEFDPHTVKPGPVSATMVLRAGDVLYVPRGVMHDARTVDGEESLHVTLGVMSRSWTDLLAETLLRVGGRDVRFREALPPGFHREGFDSGPMRERFHELLRAFAEQASFEEARGHMTDELLDARQAIVPGQLAQWRAARSLTVETACGVRPEFIGRVEREGDTVRVFAYGGELSLPARVEGPLRYALATPRFSPGDLPGDLDAEGRLVLVRRLVREGLVRVL